MVSSNTDYVDFLIILHMVNKTFGDLARQKNSYRQMLIYIYVKEYREIRYHNKNKSKKEITENSL